MLRASAVPNARYHHPMAPISAVIGACELACAGDAACFGQIHLGMQSLSTPSSPTARLMVTVGIPSGEGGSLVPAPWASSAGSLRVAVDGMPSDAVPADSYPRSSPHPAAARSFGMVDVTEAVRHRYDAAMSAAVVGYGAVVTLLVAFQPEPRAAPTPFSLVFLACWCEPTPAEAIVGDAIRLARAAAQRYALAHRVGSPSAAVGAFPIAGSQLPFAASTQQQLQAAAVPPSAEADDDEVEFLGSNAAGSAGVSAEAAPRSADSRFVLVPDDPVITLAPVSFRCPLSYSLMTVPVKGAHCAHVAAFDASTYVRHCLSGTNAWNCPLCNAEARHTDLVVCAAVEDAMHAYGALAEEEDCDSCFLRVDMGNAARGPVVVGWAPCEAAVEEMRRREVDDDEGGEGDDDYDRHRATRSTRRR